MSGHHDPGQLSNEQLADALDQANGTLYTGWDADSGELPSPVRFLLEAGATRLRHVDAELEQQRRSLQGAVERSHQLAEQLVSSQDHGRAETRRAEHLADALRDERRAAHARRQPPAASDELGRALLEALRQVGDVARRYAHAHGVLVGALSIAVDELTSDRHVPTTRDVGRSLGEVLEAQRDPLIEPESPAPAADRGHP